jgi:transcriptional regulator with XRE-family HTH domain
MTDKEDDAFSVGKVPLDALIAAALYQPPALEADPGAHLLGLVSDPSRRLNTAELSRLRRNSHLTVSQLATRLQRQGWDVSSGQILRWEMKGSSDAVPALVEAIAAVLDVDQERLLTHGDDNQLTELRSSAKFGELVQRLAALRDVSMSAAAAMLESRLGAAVYRGNAPDLDQTLQSLEQLVNALEQRDR